MAKKTSSKTTAKSAATPVVPAVVKKLNNLAIDMANVSDIPETLVDARSKLVASINRYADRVAANLAGAGKKAEKETAKKGRVEAKTKRDAAKREKKIAARDALRKKLAAMDAELKS